MGAIISQATATIASGQTVGAAFYTGAKVPVALQMPSAITGANFSFQGSPDGVTYQAIYLGGANYAVAVAVAKNVVLNASAFAGLPFVKLVSDAAEAADRSVIVITRDGGR